MDESDRRGTNADILYVNGNIHTMDGADSVARAVAVAGGRILAVGDEAEVRGHAGPGTEIVDLGGRTMTPGFIDAHGHFPESGNTRLYRVDVTSPPVGRTESIDDVVEALRRKAERTPPGEWVVGCGYDDTLLREKRHPTRHDLDRASTEHPIWLTHVSYHLGVANGLALRRAGITAETPQPPGGVIRIDRTDGAPDGVFEEPAAMFLVSDHIPEPTLEQDLAAIAEAAREYAGRGVTTAQNAFSDKRMIRHFVEAAKLGRLPIRLLFLPVWEVALEISRGDFEVGLPDDGMAVLGPAKMFADGSIQGYTGYLSRPYHVPFDGDEDYRGYPIYERDRLTAIVGELHRAGWQIAIHGNGDAAIDDILHAYRSAQAGHARPDARHVIVHAQMARDDQLEAMKELGVTPSFFSLHTYYWGDRHRDIFMGPERAARISPARGAADRGIRFTIHCDTPVVPMTPLLLMWAAVNRISTGGSVIGAEQRITPREALRAQTIDAAWQYFLDDEIGSIEPGKRADLVVLSDDPLACPPEAIRDIEVLRTVVGGRTVHAS